MMPTDYIPEARGRLDAAWDYIQNFKAECDRFFNSQPYGIVCDQEFKGTFKVLCYRFVITQRIPQKLRRPITACMGELRPVLDNLLYGLSQIVGESSSCGIDFPLCLDDSLLKPKAWCFSKWVRDNQGVLAKFPAGAVDLIRQLQPFNPDKRGNLGTNHILYVLNRLANQDKHKIPIQVTGVNQNRGALIRGPIVVTATSEAEARANPLVITTGPLKPNSIIAQLTVPTSQPTNDVETKIAAYIAFEQEGSAGGTPVYEFLINAHNFIRDEIVTKFEPFFPK